ncbi:unnamed protein product [Caenorhabditis angaria]|uniref:Uncharacterized protein n=1 Tax=Caenorhabditis angaria TaxID=860376 RepID=A0A9P1J1V9_9PELO|nr:unnamed protein product [Caenorhabditis angaria]
MLAVDIVRSFLTVFVFGNIAYTAFLVKTKKKDVSNFTRAVMIAQVIGQTSITIGLFIIESIELVDKHFGTDYLTSFNSSVFSTLIRFLRDVGFSISFNTVPLISCELQLIQRLIKKLRFTFRYHYKYQSFAIFILANLIYVIMDLIFWKSAVEYYVQLGVLFIDYIIFGIFHHMLYRPDYNTEKYQVTYNIIREHHIKNIAINKRKGLSSKGIRILICQLVILICMGIMFCLKYSKETHFFWDFSDEISLKIGLIFMSSVNSLILSEQEFDKISLHSLEEMNCTPNIVDVYVEHSRFLSDLQPWLMAVLFLLIFLFESMIWFSIKPIIWFGVVLKFLAFFLETHVCGEGISSQTAKVLTVCAESIYIFAPIITLVPILVANSCYTAEDPIWAYSTSAILVHSYLACSQVVHYFVYEWNYSHTVKIVLMIHLAISSLGFAPFIGAWQSEIIKHAPTRTAICRKFVKNYIEPLVNRIAFIRPLIIIRGPSLFFGIVPIIYFGQYKTEFLTNNRAIGVASFLEVTCLVIYEIFMGIEKNHSNMVHPFN